MRLRLRLREGRANLKHEGDEGGKTETGFAIPFIPFQVLSLYLLAGASEQLAPGLENNLDLP